MPKVNTGALAGQWAMFRDFAKRYRATRRLMDRIQPEDYVYAVSDYWFDVWPAVRCPARQKLMVLHMQAPDFWQVVRRSRPDVDPIRLASSTIGSAKTARWPPSAAARASGYCMCIRPCAPACCGAAIGRKS